MEIIPAIDIKDGKCVRLYQGDYSQQTIFDTDPVSVALKWRSAGARWLHIIDLDGAATGKPKNISVIKQIIKTSGLLVEVGGGIRKQSVVEQLLHAGINRVILGTIAIEKPNLVQSLCHQFGESIVVGLDARHGKIAIHGWQVDTDINIMREAQRMLGFGVKRFIYTDIQKDGTLTEPNFDAVQMLVSRLGVAIIAAGGISTIEHLNKLKKLGVDGAIIGRALYTGDINLSQAIANNGG